MGRRGGRPDGDQLWFVGLCQWAALAGMRAGRHCSSSAGAASNWTDKRVRSNTTIHSCRWLPLGCAGRCESGAQRDVKAPAWASVHRCKRALENPQQDCAGESHARDATRSVTAAQRRAAAGALLPARPLLAQAQSSHFMTGACAQRPPAVVTPSRIW